MSKVVTEDNVIYMHDKMLSFVNYCPKEVRFKMPRYLERLQRMADDVKELKRNDYKEVEEEQSFVLNEDTSIAKKMTEDEFFQFVFTTNWGRQIRVCSGQLLKTLQLFLHELLEENVLAVHKVAHFEHVPREIAASALLSVNTNQNSNMAENNSPLLSILKNPKITDGLVRKQNNQSTVKTTTKPKTVDNQPKPDKLQAEVQPKTVTWQATVQPKVVQVTPLKPSLKSDRKKKQRPKPSVMFVPIKAKVTYYAPGFNYVQSADSIKIIIDSSSLRENPTFGVPPENPQVDHSQSEEVVIRNSSMDMNLSICFTCTSASDVSPSSDVQENSSHVEETRRLLNLQDVYHRLTTGSKSKSVFGSHSINLKTIPPKKAQLATMERYLYKSSADDVKYLRNSPKPTKIKRKKDKQEETKRSQVSTPSFVKDSASFETMGPKQILMQKPTAPKSVESIHNRLREGLLADPDEILNASVNNVPYRRKVMKTKPGKKSLSFGKTLLNTKQCMCQTQEINPLRTPRPVRNKHNNTIKQFVPVDMKSAPNNASRPDANFDTTKLVKYWSNLKLYKKKAEQRKMKRLYGKKTDDNMDFVKLMLEQHVEMTLLPRVLSRMKKPVKQHQLNPKAYEDREPSIPKLDQRKIPVITNTFLMPDYAQFKEDLLKTCSLFLVRQEQVTLAGSQKDWQTITTLVINKGSSQ